MSSLPSKPSLSTDAPDERPPRRPTAHVLAFETLYEFDLARHPARDVLSRLATEQDVEERTERAAELLVDGVLEQRASLDATISTLAPTWPLVQMSAIDRNILRLGLFELCRSDQPAHERSAINTAVNLAKRYGGDSSPRFVRGVLGRAAGLRRPAETPGDHDPPGPEPRTT